MPHLPPPAVALIILSAAHWSRDVSADEITSPKCLPNRRFTSIYNYSDPAYGQCLESTRFDYTVTLENCSTCGVVVQLQIGKTVCSNLPAYSALSNPGEIGEAAYSVAQARMHARQDIPDWIKQSIALPYYERFSTSGYCNYFSRNVSFSVFLNLTSLSIRPAEDVCSLFLQRMPYHQAAHFYWTFFGYATLGRWHYRSNFQVYSEFFPSEWADRAQRATTLISAYCTPITLLLMCFALSVVQKSLDGSDAHVYVYHKALTVVDMLMAVFLFLKETYLSHYLFGLFCYVAPSKFRGSLGDVKEEDLPASIITLPVVWLASVASTIQALLAFDRFVALYRPLTYMRFANRRNVKRLILAAVLLNLASLAAELSTDTMLPCLFQASCIVSYENGYFRNGHIPRSCILALACLTQVFCCSAVFAKMLLRFRESASDGNHGNGQQQSVRRKLVPFYLLIGTCVLSFAGLCVEILQIVHSQFSTLFFVSFAVSPTRVFLSRFRLSIMSMGNSCGLFVHLMVCSECRQAARKSLGVIGRHAAVFVLKAKGMATTASTFLRSKASAVEPSNAIEMK